MPATTIKVSYISSFEDQYKDHIKRHKDEHTYMKYDKEGTKEIELLSNMHGISPQQSAYRVAEKQGMKTRSEFEEYNSKQRKDRQKTYDEYVLGSSGSQQKAIKNAMQDESQKAYSLKQLNCIEKNKLAVTGTLYYIGNVDVYDNILDTKGSDGLKRYREFERQTFRDQHEDPRFKALHPYISVSEIHNDEEGALHAQDQEVWGRTNKRGVYKIARTQMIDDILVNEFSNDERVQNMMSLTPKSQERQRLSKDIYIQMNNEILQEYAEKNNKLMLEPYGMKWEHETGVSEGSKNLSKHDYIVLKKAKDEAKLEAERLLLEVTEKVDNVVNETTKRLEERERLLQARERQLKAKSSEVFQKLSEARIRTNEAYANKKAYDDEYNASWGKYSARMANVRKKQDSIWKDPKRRAEWDNAASGLKNAKDMQKLSGNVTWLDVVFSIVGVIQENKYEKQIEALKQQREKALEENRLEAQAVKDEWQEAKNKIKTLKSEITRVTNERNDLQNDVKVLKRDKIEIENQKQLAKQGLLPFQKEAKQQLMQSEILLKSTREQLILHNKMIDEGKITPEQSKERVDELLMSVDKTIEKGKGLGL